MSSGADGGLPRRLGVVAQAYGCNNRSNHTSRSIRSWTLAALSCLVERWYPPGCRSKDYPTVADDADAQGSDLWWAGTYGEITLEGSTLLFEAINATGEGLGEEDVFADLGAGLGKFLLQAFLTTGISEAVGVELGVARYRIASSALNATRRALGLEDNDGDDAQEAIKLIHGNILEVAEQWSFASIIYFASLCMDTTTMMAVGWRMSAVLSPGTIVFSLKEFPGCFPGLLRVSTLHVPMSWKESGDPVLMYVVTPPPVLPQPAWLVSTAPAISEVLVALGLQNSSDHAVSSVNVPRWAWEDAGQRAWPASSSAMLWRLTMTAGPALGFVVANGTDVPSKALLAILQDRMHGSLSRRATACAGDALAAVLFLIGIGHAVTDVSLDVEELMGRMANLSLQDSRGHTMASLAARAPDEHMSLQVLEILLAEHKLRPELELLSKPCVLCSAAQRGHTEVVRLLLSGRAAHHSRDVRLRQPLHYAMRYGHEHIADLLLAHGASLEARDAAGNAPWDVVPRENRIAAKELLHALQEWYRSSETAG